MTEYPPINYQVDAIDMGADPQNVPGDKMTSDQAQALEAWQTVERKEERIEQLSSVLLDVEGALLAYWTDVPETEVERLRVLIRETLA